MTSSKERTGKSTHDSTGMSATTSRVAMETQLPALVSASSPRSDDSFDVVTQQLGLERRKSDMRQLGALLIILGMGSSFSALALTAILVEGMAGAKQIYDFKLPALVATIIQTLIGMVAIVSGFVTLISTPFTSRAHFYAKILVCIVNLGPISFAITLIKLAMGASEPPEDNPFIPPSMNPNQSDIRMVCAMGILALVSVCTTLIGGLTIVGLSLCAYLGGQQVDKHQGYYVIRYAFYNLMVFLGGFSQLLLGIFLSARFGPGPYDQAVHVTTYTVFFPYITAIVGTVQTFMGVYGWSRAVGWIKIQGESDSVFLYVTLITWIITMVLQIIVQPSFGTGDSFDAEGATYAAVYVGFFVMPAWLDHMVRYTPKRIDPSYFGLPACTQCKEDMLCKIFGLTESQFFSGIEGKDEQADGLEYSLNHRHDHESTGSASIAADLESDEKNPWRFGG